MSPGNRNNFGGADHCITDCSLTLCYSFEGTGTFGRVRLVRHLDNGNYYALKISKKASIIRMKQVGSLQCLSITIFVRFPVVAVNLLCMPTETVHAHRNSSSGLLVFVDRRLPTIAESALLQGPTKKIAEHNPTF